MAFLGQRGSTNGIPNMLFRDGMTFSPDITFEAYVYVIGGGGSGGAVGTAISNNYAASGGGAGGCAVSRLILTANQNYVITIGAGGNYAGGAGVSDGNDGTNTTFVNSGESVSITGNGGAGGNQSSHGAGASAASGGDASGHNLVKYAGGDGLATDASRKASGGGAVGIYEPGRSGVVFGHTDANTPTGDGGTMHGQQVGGTYGETDIRYNYHNNNLGPPVVMSPFSDLYTITTSDARAYQSSTFWEAQMDYTPSNAQPAPYGGGSRTATQYIMTGTSGPFAGGNSLFNASSDYHYAWGGNGSLGGGGGAVINNKSSGTAEAFSGRGGNGAVLIFPIAMG
tara:strand:- start:1056 stop:2075 length:1020 start_codon:yes stop_codon:yes gene_type:complete